MKTTLQPFRILSFWIYPISAGTIIRFLVVAFNPHLIIWDEVSFHDLAKRLSQGESYGIPFWPPEWPYLLAILYRVLGTTDHYVGTWFNLVVSIATLVLFGLLTTRLFSRTVAAVALWLMALMPSYSLANGLLIYEVWMQFLLIAVMYVAATRTWSWRRVFIISSICGLLTLIRPTWLILPLVLWLMVIMAGYKLPLRRLIITQLGVIVFVAPWIIYASNLSGRFVPIALQGGLHLWMANNPAATGTHVDPPAEFWDPRNEPLAMKAAVDFISQNPSHLVTILPAKMWFMFRAEAWTAWFFNTTEPPQSPATVGFITLTGDIYYYAVLILFMLSAIAVVYSRWSRYVGALIPFGYGILAEIVLFTGQLKYRWPLQFILIMYAALTIVWITARWQKSPHPLTRQREPQTTI